VTCRADRAVAELAARQWAIVSLSELRECGLSKTAVGVRVRRGNLHPVHHGVYAVGHRNVALEGRFLAAVKACGPRTVLAYYAAAVLHSLLQWDGRAVDVIAPSRHRLAGIAAHQSERFERVVVKGIPVTPKLRTVIDLARVEDDATVKRALRAAKFSAGELERLPRRVLELGAVPTRSPVEDRAHDVVIRGGLRAPAEVNAPYRLPTGTVYPDLRWPELRLIVEVDSAQWHDDPLAQVADRERQAELEAMGERVLRVRKAELRRRPDRFLARLRAAGVEDA
jgi:very-short-patch-repair endonuclease